MSFQPHTRINFSQALAHVQDRIKQSEEHFHENFPTASQTFSKLQIKPRKIHEHAKKLLASTITAGALLTSGVSAVTPPEPLAIKQPALSSEQKQQKLKEGLQAVLPANSLALTKEQEAEISKLIKETYGIEAVAELEGNRLNHAYGIVGGEQHLPRFPGDTISQHDEYQKSGITPGRSAWGYFANSKEELTEDLIQKEKYYMAVQTLYLPDWNTNTKYLKDWYKHREVIVINPTTGKTMLAVIADAGPAKWTGKQFGGSPEVMQYLQLFKDGNKGKAVLFFVKDPDHSLALGVLEPQSPQMIAQTQ